MVKRITKIGGYNYSAKKTVMICYVKNHHNIVLLNPIEDSLHDLSG